ncbi:MAG: hypothetical protein H7308_17240 [Chthonomonadaceae bacterium]|nr:hypothetical protein [Chthonomonadaceae bacterium]
MERVLTQRQDVIEAYLESLMPFGVQWRIEKTLEGHQVRWRAGCASYSVLLRYDVGDGTIACTLERLVQEATIKRYTHIIAQTYRIIWGAE